MWWGAGVGTGSPSQEPLRMPLDTGSLAWEGRWEPELLPLPILRHPPSPGSSRPFLRTHLLSPSEGRSSTMKMRKV